MKACPLMPSRSNWKSVSMASGCSSSRCRAQQPPPPRGQRPPPGDATGGSTARGGPAPAAADPDGNAHRIDRRNHSAASQPPRPTARELRNRADENWDVRVPVKAGERDVTVAFLKKTRRSTKPCGCRFCGRIPPATTSPSRAWARRCAAWKSAARMRRARRATRRAAGASSCAGRGRSVERASAPDAGKPRAPRRFFRPWRVARTAGRSRTPTSPRCWRCSPKAARKADSRPASNGR